MNLQPLSLENELIKLIPLTNDHFDKVYLAASDPFIWAQHPAPDRYKREVFEQFFADGIKSNGAFTIFDAKTGGVIGTSRYYDYDKPARTIAIGYTFLTREYWGTAYNRNLKNLMINYAFEYIDSILFHVGAVNIRSQKAVEKLGAEKYAEEMRDDKLYYYYKLEKEN